MLSLFKLSLVLLYLFFASAVPLSVSFSESSSGKLVYNVTFAVLLIEFTKWSTAILLDVANVFPPQNSADKKIGEPWRRPPAFSSWKNYLRYSIPGLLFAFENNLKVYATFYLRPTYFALFNTSKIFFAAVCARLILKQRFTFLQWLSLVLLMLSLMVAKGRMIAEFGQDDTRRILLTESSRVGDGGSSPIIPSLFDVDSATLRSLATGEAMETPPQFLVRMLERDGEEDAAEDAAKEAARFIHGLFLCMLVSAISGLAGVTNEFLLKKTDETCSLMRKNQWMYEWGIIFNVLGVLLKSFYGSSTTSKKGLRNLVEDPTSDLFEGFSFGVWALIFCTAFMGLSTSLIFKYFDNVVKCFCASLVIFIVAVVSYVGFGHSVDAFFPIALGIYMISSYMYMGPHNKILKECEGKSGVSGVMGGGGADLARETEMLATSGDSSTTIGRPAE